MRDAISIVIRAGNTVNKEKTSCTASSEDTNYNKLEQFYVQQHYKCKTMQLQPVHQKFLMKPSHADQMQVYQTLSPVMSLTSTAKLCLVTEIYNTNDNKSKNKMKSKV